MALSKKKLQPSSSRLNEQIWRLWPLLSVGLVILFFSAIRIRLLHMPLERDEGEYAYAGQLILQGIAPYKLAYNMKLPGTYAAYALIMAVFGQTAPGIHMGMIVVNAITVLLVFAVARHLLDDIAAVVSAICYALLSNSESVLGFAGHATHFVVLGAVAGIFYLLKALDSKQPIDYLLSGFLMGVAFVMKQPGLVFAAFGFFILLLREWRQLKSLPGLARLALYSTGAALPFGITCLLMLFSGNFGKMWYWTFAYASQYASSTILWEGWENLFIMGAHVMEPSFLIWILALLGLAALAWDPRYWKHASFMVGLFVFSWFGVSAGFYFRPHYFILMFPALSLLAGIAVGSAENEISRLISKPAAVRSLVAALFLVVAGFSIYLERDILFNMDLLSISHWAYGPSPFPEAEVISKYLDQKMDKDATIAVLGSEPEIYFLAHRHSATGYIYVYPLFEPQIYAQQMQKDMAREIEGKSPQYVVLIKVSTSWGVRSASDRWILRWFRDYLHAHYQIAGIADELSPQTRYVWGDAARTYREESEFAIEIYKRSQS
jgi:hypothetical protein